ncbi:MAG: PLP-dependent aminotransferase family protein [Oscillospiraceae bacterium]|nr:PLP-dependent aminotransferase family protein [Oscillospiraceae bacterium]
MKYVIEKHGRESAYVQLYKQLREDVVNGVLPAGAKLPSKRLLAEELELSVITVEHAYALLVDEGYAEARPRSGYYAAFGGSPGGAAPRRAALEEMSAGAAARTEDFPFSVWARTMRAVLSDYDRRILIKSPNAGCPELRGAISAYLARSRGLSVRPEQIVIGSGAEYLYGLVVQLLGRDRLFALEDPCYEKIRRVYEANGARCELLPMGEDGIRSEALRRCAAGVLHVTPFHSFPSGVTASAAKRHEYAAWAGTHGAFIVEDDYDAEFASLTRQIETIFSLAPDRVLYVNTFSKILAPSMRTGFLVLPEPLLPLYAEKLDFYSCTVPVYDQYVLAEFIDAGHLERYINRRRRKLREKNR